MCAGAGIQEPVGDPPSEKPEEEKPITGSIPDLELPSEAVPPPAYAAAVSAAGSAAEASSTAVKKRILPLFGVAGGDASGGEESNSRRIKTRREPITFQPNPQPTAPPVLLGAPRAGAVASPAVRGQVQGHRPGVRLGGLVRGAVQALQEATVCPATQPTHWNNSQP